jgi:hypothetical protein
MKQEAWQTKTEGLIQNLGDTSE